MNRDRGGFLRHPTEVFRPLPQVVIGARVRLAPEILRSRGLSDSLYTIQTSVVGSGDDTFVKLTRPDGSELPRWFRVTELLPPTEESKGMGRSVRTDLHTETILARAHQFVANSDGTLHLNDGIKRAAAEMQPEREIHDATHTPSTRTRRLSAAPIGVVERPLLLSRHAHESFTDVVYRTQREQGGYVGDIIRTAGRTFPDLAERHRHQ